MHNRTHHPICRDSPIIRGSFPVLLTSEQGKIALGKHLAIFEDPSTELTIEQILSSQIQRKFNDHLYDIPNFGFTKSVFWAKIHLVNETQDSRLSLLEMSYPLGDHIELFIFDGTQLLEHQTSGDQLLFENRDVVYRNFVFEIPTPPHTERTIYLRFQSESSMQFPLTLWTPLKFAEKVNKELYGLGIYYGIMLVMIIYNLFIFFSVRDLSYFYYVMYIAMYAMTQLSLNGLAFEYLWPNWPWWGNRSLPFFIGMTTFFVVPFSQSYLRMKQNTPRLHRLWYGFAVLAAFVVGASLFLNYGLTIQITVATLVIGSSSLLITGTIIWRQGFRAARFFMLAWVTFLAGIIAVALKSAGILPTMFVTEYGVQIGSALEVILLSLGLADRINDMKKERAKAQGQALRLQQQINLQLEEQVSERTRELQKSHDALSRNNIIIQRQNDIFHALMETSVNIAQANDLEDLFRQTLERLAHLYPQWNFGIILNGGRPEIVEMAVFSGIKERVQKLLVEHNSELLLYSIKPDLLAEKVEKSYPKEGLGKISKDIFDNITILLMLGSMQNVMGKLIIEGPDLDQQSADIIMIFLEQVTAVADNQILTKQLEKLANTDDLTNTFNRSYFDRSLEGMIEKANKYSEVPFSIFLIDVNGLKRVNDVFGHQDGDALIIKVAEVLTKVSRETDIVARLGGDEFIILSPSTSLDGAQILLERIREEEKKSEILCMHANGDQETIPVRMSIGVASSNEETPDDALKLADSRMYEDKKQFYENHDRYRSF